MPAADVRNASILTAVAVLLRFPTLGEQSFDRDEAITVVRILQPDLVETLRIVPSETSPPLYYVLAWGWSRVFGLGEAGIRSLSALAAVATVPVAYEIGRTLASRRVGVVAGALMAVNPLLFWFSYEARPYALLVFLSALSFLCFVKALEKQSTGRLAGWVAASALAFATHWFAAFLIAPEALSLLWRSSDRRRAALAVGATLAVSAPLLPLLLHQAAHGGGDWIGTIALGERLRGVGEQFVVGATGVKVEHAATVAGALVCAGLLLLVVRAGGSERRGGLLALAVGGAAVAIPIALAFVGPDYVLDKNLLPALVPLGVAVAAGMGAHRAGAAGLAAAVALCALSLGVVGAMTFDSDLQRADVRGAVRAMGEPAGTRAIVLPFNYDASLEAYATQPVVLSEGSARVGEVVVLGPVDAPTVHLPRGFRPVERRELRTFRMIRFRADRPLPVDHRALATTGFGSVCNPAQVASGCEQAAVILERAVAER